MDNLDNDNIALQEADDITDLENIDFDQVDEVTAIKIKLLS